MSDYDVNYYATRFHGNQFKAWQDFYKFRFLIVKAGRRWGKSYMCSEIIIDEAFKKNDEFPITSGISFIAKTKDQARDILWDTFKERLRARGLNKIVKCNEQQLEAVFPNGLKLSVEGADVEEDRLRGTGKRLVVCDEFSFWKKNKYLWQEILRPMLISPKGGVGGKAIICSTPQHAENYFEDLFQRGLSGEGGYHSLHFTTFDNPLISPQEMAQIAVDYGGTNTDEYKREILAITTRTSDLVFRDFEDREPYTQLSSESQYYDKKNGQWSFPSRDFIHFAGIDFGNKDPTVCLSCVLDWERDHLYVIGEHYKTQELIENHAKAMQELFRISNKPKPLIYGDHDAQEIMEYARYGVSISKAEKDIRTGIARMISRIQQKKITIFKDKCPNLIREMIMMQWDERKDKPASNQDDHAIDALRYVVKGINMGNFVKPNSLTEEERLEQRLIRKLRDKKDNWHLYED